MSEGRLTRWSRLKQAAREQPEKPPEAEAAPAAVSTPSEAPADDTPSVKLDDLPKFDITKLPSIDSLMPGSDLKPFMQAGVPEELRHRAMRRLWSIDPAIRDFRTPAEYDWNFNAPGYGDLLPTDDVKKILEGVIRSMARIDAEAAKPIEDKPLPLQDVAPTPADSPLIAPAESPAPSEDASAPEAERVIEPAPRRRHGGAVPT